MRTVTIERKESPLGQPIACKVLADERPIGELKAEESKKSYPISKGEHAIQVQIEGADGRLYRSNSYFATGGASFALYLTISGTKLTLVYDK